MLTSKPGYAEISAKQLMRLIGTPDAPIILDVCLPEDVAAAPYRIPGSRAADHRKIAETNLGSTSRHIVLVCQKGKKLSHGTAALLRAKGHTAEVLAGGIQAWLATDYPRTPIANLPKGHHWVTRHRPKIDRIACPWLIRRFVDPDAVFLYVPPAEVMDVAARFDAIPFDVPKADFTHQDGRCTFDAMLQHFGLQTPELTTMAAIIRAADTDDLSTVPQAAGLLALSVGLSRMYKDDGAQLDAAMSLYDALYRWARDGQAETHDWDKEVGA